MYIGNRFHVQCKFQWDDGDPSGRVQKYDMVALNIEPEDDDLGVGQRVFFPQVTNCKQCWIVVCIN